MSKFEITDTQFGDKYKEQLYSDFDNLLLNSPTDENAFQDFLEKNPALVPGGNCVFGESGHAPYMLTLISQPSLNGLTERIPDFMWFAKDSLTFEPVLIEIEAPSKRIFNQNGTPSADFTKAKNQLTEWKAILKQPQNILKFYDEYNIPLDLRKLDFRPTFVLIYGRRSEYEGDDILTNKRANLMGENEMLMSFDRLTINPKGVNSTTSYVKNGKYHAKYVSPVMTISEIFKPLYSNILDLDKAIDNSMYIANSRKLFMKKKINEILSAPPKPDDGKLIITRMSDYKFE